MRRIYKICEDKDNILKFFCFRNSEVIGPKIRVPKGLKLLLRITTQLVSNLIKFPIVLCLVARVCIIKALNKSPLTSLIFF